MTYQERIYSLLLANEGGLTFARLHRLMPCAESCLRHALFRLRRKGGAASCKVAGRPLVYLAIPDRVPSDRRGKWSRAPAARINAGATISCAEASR